MDYEFISWVVVAVCVVALLALPSIPAKHKQGRAGLAGVGLLVMALARKLGRDKDVGPPRKGGDAPLDAKPTDYQETDDALLVHTTQTDDAVDAVVVDVADRYGVSADQLRDDLDWLNTPNEP